MCRSGLAVIGKVPGSEGFYHSSYTPASFSLLELCFWPACSMFTEEAAAPQPASRHLCTDNPSRAVWHEDTTQPYTHTCCLVPHLPRKDSAYHSPGEKGAPPCSVESEHFQCSAEAAVLLCPLFPLSLMSDHIKVTINFSVCLSLAPCKHHLSSPPVFQRQGKLGLQPNIHQ